MYGRNILYSTQRVVLALLLIVVGAGLVRAESAVHTDFRVDGRLTFLNTSGTPLVEIPIEIAETAAERSRGLMERHLAGFSWGMLFVYHDAAPRSFWMANTPTSLDILFLDNRGRVVNIHKHTRPMSISQYRSAGPSQFVVEVRAGFCDHYGIIPGTQVHWQRL